MIEGLSVLNYRGFRAQTELQLKPITVLLGRNSSGKSSLTRLIPLIQQSLERQSSSPILWASDAVDLGNIKDVLSHYAGNDPLRLSFQIGDLDFAQVRSRRLSSFGSRFDDRKITYELRLRADGIRTRFEGLSLTIDDQCVSIEWNSDGVITDILVNDKPFPFEPDAYVVIPTTIFPAIYSRLQFEENGRQFRQPIFYPIVRDKLGEFFHQRTSSQKMDYWSRKLSYISRSDIREAVSSIPNVVKSRLSNTDNLTYLSDASLINDLPNIIRDIGEHSSSIFQSSAYIGPSRASGNRFDRIQELAVNRIDAAGLNTAMYLYSLSDEEKDSFNELLIRACGHMIEIQESGHGHVSIKVGRFGDSHFENIADVGFGFSQIIPVVAQLHAVQNRRPSPEYYYAKQAIFAVEQPELHLHPAMQANLADLFVGAVNATTTHTVERTTIVIETHSETLVSRLGLLVAGEEISPDDVAIYFVEKDEKSGHSVLRSTMFNADGIIEDWPVGFFSAT